MRAALPCPPASRATRHLRRSPASAAAALASIATLALLAGCAPPDRARGVAGAAPAAPVAAVATAPLTPAPLATAADALPPQRVVNALYVSIIDDDEPPRFTTPDVAAQCGEATTVQVDGAPMASGARIPGPVFQLRWQIDGCRTLGESGPLLAGRYDVLVMHDDEHGPGAVLLAHDPLGGPGLPTPLGARTPAVALTAR
jgi:hypothetical protein